MHPVVLVVEDDTLEGDDIAHFRPRSRRPFALCSFNTVVGRPLYSALVDDAEGALADLIEQVVGIERRTAEELSRLLR